MKRIFTRLFLYLMSHIQQVKKSHQEINDQICSLLRISPEDLYWLKVDAGRHYLSHLLSADATGHDQLLKSKLFWGWFVNKWIQIDEQLLKEGKLIEYRRDKVEYYREAHKSYLQQTSIPSVVKESKKSISKSINQ